VLQLEKSNKTINKELSDLKSEVDSQQAKIRQQTKELKDAVTAKKFAMEEFTQLNEKVRFCRIAPITVLYFLCGN